MCICSFLKCILSFEKQRYRKRYRTSSLLLTHAKEVMPGEDARYSDPAIKPDTLYRWQRPSSLILYLLCSMNYIRIRSQNRIQDSNTGTVIQYDEIPTDFTKPTVLPPLLKSYYSSKLETCNLF